MYGIECFAIEMSSVTLNWLPISDAKLTDNVFVKYCEPFVCLFAVQSLIAL